MFTGHNGIPVFAIRVLLVIVLVFLSFFSFGVSAHADGYSAPHDARPSEDGQLSVHGTQIVNRSGEPVMLRGISTHGLTWYPDYVNDEMFGYISREWGSNMVRLAMYSEDYIQRRESNLKVLHAGIEAAIKADMYVLVDWHILSDSNPMQNVEEAKRFFADIAAEYADVPNIIYEICNEPNGSTVWDDIYEYSNIIIPVIRKHSPGALIVVGTPEYDQDLESPLKKPLDDNNTLYSFHFYTTSHHEDMMQKLDRAINAGLPVFISECGITEADGNGAANYEYAGKWFSYLHEHGISYAVWNLSNKQETSSFIKATSGAVTSISDADLTHTGKWVRSLMRGEDPYAIVKGETYQEYSFFDFFVIQIRSLGRSGLMPVNKWTFIALCCASVMLAAIIIGIIAKAVSRRKCRTYDDLVRLGGGQKSPGGKNPAAVFKYVIILIFLFLSLVYLAWRIFFSVNTEGGWLPVVCNVILLIVEIFGFIESCIHYSNMMNIRRHPLPEIEDSEYPEVDIFIATYNEPEDLIMRTVNGCKHLKYPDKSKVHIWVCDDNRRSGMRKLAEDMGVGYFDRPDNSGAKAGNLNNAMAHTSAPYVVTLDADMIVKSDFLLKTIPYFVYAEKCNATLPVKERKPLGLLQTPQCFYDPDVFQHALYSEKNIPNEQDFFYRTIEPAKTSTNSVIYGGSNTVIARAAIEAIGGFYTESITEDFATGLLIESAGFVSLGLDEPLASGRTPNTFADHIKQRTRWGRGVINTAKNLHPMTRHGLTLGQRLSYWSSVTYWYSPVKNLVYILSPLMFAAFMIPVFRCNWLELLVYWLPMFIMQGLCLRIIGRNAVSLKWSSIYETSVMPYLLIPIIKETFGISMKKFQVTDKSKKQGKNRRESLRLMLPFLILLLLSVFGILRILFTLQGMNAFGMIIILFWLVRNLYSIVMVLFLINGRDSDDDTESVCVKYGELASLTKQADGTAYDGITTVMTEHNLSLFIDDPDGLKTGDIAEISVDTEDYGVKLKGIVTGIKHLRFSGQCVASLEILDYNGFEEEYLQILYDRVPTLPQSLGRDFGLIALLWRNIVYRAMRTL